MLYSELYSCNLKLIFRIYSRGVKITCFFGAPRCIRGQFGIGSVKIITIYWRHLSHMHYVAVVYHTYYLKTQKLCTISLRVCLLDSFSLTLTADVPISLRLRESKLHFSLSLSLTVAHLTCWHDFSPPLGCYSDTFGYRHKRLSAEFSPQSLSRISCDHRCRLLVSLICEERQWARANRSPFCWARNQSKGCKNLVDKAQKASRIFIFLYLL